MTAKSQLQIAIEIAIVAHGEQMYGSNPYIYHLNQVDRIAVKRFVNVKDHCEQYSKVPGDFFDNLRATCYLHDIIEDTDVTIEDLKAAGINDEVCDAVTLLTKVDLETYSDYILAIRTNSLATRVKLCDTATNLEHSIRSSRWSNIDKYSKQIKLLGGFTQYD